MQLIKIRFYQLKRDLGILFFAVLLFFSGFSFILFNYKQQIGLYVIGFIGYLFYSFHKNRKDISFIGKHFNGPKRQLITEYQIFLLPLSVPCLFTSYWFCFPLLHLLVFSIAFFDVKSKIQLKLFFLTRLLKNDYIFISGVRKNYFVLTAFLIIAVVLSPLKLFPLVALFLFNSILFSFYETNESVQMLQSSNLSPKQFLLKFSRSAFAKMTVINIPILLVNTLCNPDLLPFNCYFFGYNLLILATVIALKYSNYSYHKPVSSIQMKLLIMSLGLFMPYLLPLAVIFYFQSKSEAIHNLKNYLDDNH